MLLDNCGFLKWGYPQIINFSGMFPYKPTILDIYGTPQITIDHRVNKDVENDDLLEANHPENETFSRCMFVNPRGTINDCRIAWDFHNEIPIHWEYDRDIPSGNKTLQRKVDHLSVIFLYIKTSSSGIFQPTMLEYQKVLGYNNHYDLELLSTKFS